MNGWMDGWMNKGWMYDFADSISGKILDLDSLHD
jgi:hypothetical protein